MNPQIADLMRCVFRDLDNVVAYLRTLPADERAATAVTIGSALEFARREITLGTSEPRSNYASATRSPPSARKIPPMKVALYPFEGTKKVFVPDMQWNLLVEMPPPTPPRTCALIIGQNIPARASPARKRRSGPSHGCIIMHIDHILCVHQTESDLWGFPKGHAEHGETPEETAVRETREEVGLTFRLADLGHPVNPRSNGKYFKVIVSVRPAAKVDGVEIDEFEWLTAAELLGRKVSKTTKKIATDLRR